MTRFSRYVSSFSIVSDPFSASRTYFRDVLRICEDKDIDYVLPVHEDVIGLLEHWQDQEAKSKLLAPPREILEASLDKVLMDKLARSAGVKVPGGAVCCSRRDLESRAEELVKECGGAVLKPRFGNGGKGVTIITDLAAISPTIDAFEKSYGPISSENALIQERLEGSVFGACFLARNGVLLDYFGERYVLCKAGGIGSSVYRKPSDWELLRTETEKLVKKLRWNGLGHFDFIGDGGQNIGFIEMNPRLWGGINNAIANGHDFLAQYVAEFGEGKALPSQMEVERSKSGRDTCWALGVAIALVDSLKSRRWAHAKYIVEVLRKARGADCDDLKWDDIPVFLAESVHYFMGFVKAGGQINPDRPDMVVKR